MSSSEDPAGEAGSEQPAVPSSQPQQPEGPAYGPRAGEQTPASAGPPGVFPGQQPVGGPPPYGAYPAPGRPYTGEPYGAQQHGSQPYGSQQYGSQQYGSQPYAGQQYPAQPYGAQPYGAPYPGYPGYGQVYPRNDLGVWSLVLAVAGIALGLNLLTGIPAIILGRRARAAVQRGEANNDGMAVAGIVIGWIATAFGILLVLGVVAAIVIGIASSGSQSY